MCRTKLVSLGVGVRLWGLANANPLCIWRGTLFFVWQTDRQTCHSARVTNFARIQVKRRLLHFNVDSDEIKRFQDTLKRIQGRVCERFVSCFKRGFHFVLFGICWFFKCRRFYDGIWFYENSIYILYNNAGFFGFNLRVAFHNGRIQYGGSISNHKGDDVKIQIRDKLIFDVFSNRKIF